MTKQQQWAKLAFARVREVAGKEQEKKYATRCMQAPSLLQQAGLVQTLAFWGKDEEHRKFRDDVARVFGKNGQEPGKELMKQVLEADARDYIVLSRDIADIAIWFRRFAQSELKGEL